ncbi:MAG: SDR family NAD(P)-dependent oxidoreductase [Cellulophaga sp.]
MNYSKAIIITGVNRGLGEALVHLFTEKKEFLIIAISRRINSEQKKMEEIGKLVFIEKDLFYLKDVEKDIFLGRYLEGIDEICFINNASIINPIEKIGKFNSEDIYKLIQINTIVPLLISNYLLSNSENKRINFINISSGAATHPIEGWGLYCTSKSANDMFFEVLSKQESKNDNINVISIDPGVIDSGMQQLIRDTNPEVFPEIETFIKLKEQGKLLEPIEAAKRVLSKSNFFN